MVEWLLGASRFAQFLAALTLFGLAAFELYAGRQADPVTAEVQRTSATTHASHRWLMAGLAAAGLLTASGWLGAEALQLAGSWNAVVDVVRDTLFGKVLVLRGALFGLVLLLALTQRGKPGRALWWMLCAMSSIAVASFAWTGHGGFDANGSSPAHRVADVLHLLAAGIWTGALAALVLQARAALCVSSGSATVSRTADIAHELARGLGRFSVIGPAVIAVLVLSGLVNSGFLIGLKGWRALPHTAYGLSLLVKLALFLGMLGLAGVNRLWLAPRLDAALAAHTDTNSAVRRLNRSLLLESALALLVIGAVAILGLSEPPLAE